MLHTFRISHLQFLILLLLLIPVGANAQKENKNDYREKIENETQWNGLSGKPLSAKYGNVGSVKIVYDIKEKKLYFINSRRYKFHFEFCSNYLHSYNSLEEFNLVEYSASKERTYLLANLNFYRQQNIYTLEFFADDKIQAANVVKLFNLVKKSVYFPNQLYLILNSEHILASREKICNEVACMEVDSLYKGQRYQCLVTGEASGRLKFVDFRELAKADLRSTDIVVTNGLPLIIPPVAGIVTSEFQTPLSHVNMLAQSRKLPDAALRGVWTNARWKKLEGEIVKIHVTNDSVWVELTSEIIRPNATKKELKLSPDITENRLASVKYLRIKSIDAYGGKCSNMGELHRIKLKDGINLPEGAFGIPLYYYFRHAHACGASKLVDSLLKDTSILNNREKTAAMLKKIRSTIKKFPVEQSLIDSISARLKKYPQYPYFRFRSSTNAEDIEGFNGAGLYDSYSGSVTDTAKKIENALRKVWASLWNQRAFEERSIYGINHYSVGMGILVHRAFGTEKANGVAITANIYRLGYPSFVINSQHGEASVVSPEPGEQCEQLILNHKVLEITVDEISMDYISKSSLNNGEDVLTKKQLFELARCLFAVKEHFYFRTKYGRKSKGFLYFAMDVEFKIDSQTGKLYIKQARPLEVKSEK